MTAHVYRDRFGDELEIDIMPVDGEVKIMRGDCPNPEVAAVIYTDRPVKLSTVADKGEVKAAFDRGWRWGMGQAIAILSILFVLKLVVDWLT